MGQIDRAKPWELPKAIGMRRLRVAMGEEGFEQAIGREIALIGASLRYVRKLERRGS
jgi:hypothetical protein